MTAAQPSWEDFGDVSDWRNQADGTADDGEWQRHIDPLDLTAPMPCAWCEEWPARDHSAYCSQKCADKAYSARMDVNPTWLED